MWSLALFYIAFLLHQSIVLCHVPSYQSTPSNKIDHYCILAENCFHDTVPVCGQTGTQKRTFLDICDLLEYICDTNQIFDHVEETQGCPKL